MIHAKSKDVRLFSAVASMGIPWKEESASLEGGERSWLFGDISDCGKWKINELLKWWRDPSFHVNHPNNQFNIVKCVMASDRGLKLAITKHKGITQRKVGQSKVIDFTDEPSKESFSNKATNDLSFIAALSAYGFDIHESKRIADTRFFYASDKSSNGTDYETAKAWWLDKSFEAKNPHHDFAYAKSVSITYASAVEAIRKDRSLVKWKPKGGVGFAYIHPECSSQTEEKVAGWLNNE